MAIERSKCKLLCHQGCQRFTFFVISFFWYLFPGAERLIYHLDKAKVPFALATSSSDRSVKTKVAAHKELFDLFHHKVMGSTDDEVKFGKPHPDIFLVTAARFPDKPEPSKVLSIFVKVISRDPNGQTVFT